MCGLGAQVELLPLEYKRHFVGSVTSDIGRCKIRFNMNKCCCCCCCCLKSTELLSVYKLAFVAENNDDQRQSQLAPAHDSSATLAQPKTCTRAAGADPKSQRNRVRNSCKTPSATPAAATAQIGARARQLRNQCRRRQLKVVCAAADRWKQSCSQFYF